MVSRVLEPKAFIKLCQAIDDQNKVRKIKKAWETRHAKKVSSLNKKFDEISEEKLPEPKIVEEKGDRKPIKEVLT